MNFWMAGGEVGLVFLILLYFFPRITLLAFVVTPFSPLAWLGWLLTPRVLAAYIGTMLYADTNPFLVMMGWIVALSNLFVTIVAVTPQKRTLYARIRLWFYH